MPLNKGGLLVGLICACSVLVGACTSPDEPDLADEIWAEFSQLGRESACSGWRDGDRDLQLEFLSEIRYSDPENLPSAPRVEWVAAAAEALDRYC